MLPVSLALFWHQHQPYYPDDLTGEVLMPWVRLHGTKDYIGMALHILEVPEFRCTINLVPSLLVQIQRYVDGGSDLHLDMSRRPVDGLSEADACYLLDNFFMANPDSMVHPYPRYQKLLQKRNLGHDAATKALSRYSDDELRDLQVWNNLTWIHELVFERDSDLAAFRQKGEGWTEDEKQWLLERQRQLMAEIIPLHRQLMEGGQVELTTTPFYHPILPLLWDKRSARQAMPTCELPRHMDRYPEDVHRHLKAAVDYHTKMFGAPPKGMWPSEGSVSQEILASIANVGIEWIATDEQILERSTDGLVSRDSQGHSRHPEKLYCPWRVEEEGRNLQIIFRDHGLSDQIGFHYQRSNPQAAADDLLGRVFGIGQAVARIQPDRPALVPIILDGENCWEHYPDGGVKFLRRLYREAASRPEINPVRVSDHLEKYPAQDRINKLFSGSWIFHNFAIWIGHAEDRTAWDALHETRKFLKKAEFQGAVSADRIAQAWKEIDIAEGSDWFWWYGDDHSSDLDAMFDQLFRRHLENVYRLLGTSPPAMLAKAIGGTSTHALHSLPRNFLDVQIDGTTTYFEWAGAGTFVPGSERGTMTMVTEHCVEQLHFGFDASHLLLRLDAPTVACEQFANLEEIRVRFVEADETEVRVVGWNTGKLACIVLRNQSQVLRTDAVAAVGDVLEIAVPRAELNLTNGEFVSFFIELIERGQSIDRAPAEGMITIPVPGPDFEHRNWRV
ncbi:MAG: glycoside hydrolase family 57 protein [Planctomycetaceae bacterium]